MPLATIAEIEFAINISLRSFHPTAEHLDMSRYYDRPGNLAFSIDGSVMLFALLEPGVYECHYAFLPSDADKIGKARAMVKEMFTRHGARAIRGSTPRDNRAARVFHRLLGASPTGTFTVRQGRVFLDYILEREQWEASSGELSAD